MTKPKIATIAKLANGKMANPWGVVERPGMYGVANFAAPSGIWVTTSSRPRTRRRPRASEAGEPEGVSDADHDARRVPGCSHVVFYDAGHREGPGHHRRAEDVEMAADEYLVTESICRPWCE